MEPDDDEATLPADMPAERLFLAAAMQSTQAAAEALELLDPEDFYSARHAKILRSIEAVAGDGGSADILVLVDDHLRESDGATNADQRALEAAVDPKNGDASAAMLTIYAKRIRATAAARRVLLAAIPLQAARSGDPMAAAQRGIDAILDAQKRAAPRIAGYTDLGSGIEVAFKRLEEITDSKKPDLGFPTGLVDLDEMTGGMRPGKLVILGARPSVGKSAFALTVALNAVRHSRPVYLESLEMDECEIMNRLLSMASDVPSDMVRDGLISEERWPDLTGTANDLCNARRFMVGRYETGRRLRDIVADLRMAKESHGIELGIIDYLGYIEPDEPGEDRRQEVERISKGLKRAARELGIALLVLAQLSRKNEDRSKGEREPRISDLRETGMIEADADQVWLLHRAVTASEDQSDNGPREDPRKALLIVGKHRNGKTGRVPLVYRGDVTRFVNAEKQ